MIRLASFFCIGNIYSIHAKNKEDLLWERAFFVCLACDQPKWRLDFQSTPLLSRRGTRPRNEVLPIKP